MAVLSGIYSTIYK